MLIGCGWEKRRRGAGGGGSLGQRLSYQLDSLGVCSDLIPIHIFQLLLSSIGVNYTVAPDTLITPLI